MADLLSTTIAGTLNVTQGATITSNLFVSNTDIIPEINKYTRTLTDLSFDSIQGWYPTPFAALDIATTAGASVAGSSEGLFVKPDGTQLYVVDSSSARIHQLRLLSTYNVSSAVYEGNILVSAGETAPTDLFFSNTGTILYVIGQSGDAIDAYDLTVAWNVIASNTLVASNGFSVATQTITPKGMFLNSNGKYLYVSSGASTDRNLHQYTLTTNWNVATASFTSSYNIAPFTPPIDFISSVSLNPSGTKLYTLVDHDPGSSNARAMVHEFNLATPYILSTATYSSSSFVMSMFDMAGTTLEQNPTGFFLEPTSNIAYFVGQDQDRIRSAYAYRSTSVANSFVIEGKTHIRSGLEVQDAAVFANSTYFMGTGRFNSTLSVWGSADFQSGINGSGGISYGGSLTTTGDVSIGVGTGNSVHQIGYGATIADRNKQINIGTGGLAQSNTNIIIGSASGGNTNVSIFANTTNISGNLVVSGIDLLGPRLRTIWVPAQTMIPSTTSGAGTSTTETTTNDVMLKTLDFATGAVEFAQFSIRMPKSWDENGIQYEALWTADTGTGGVTWGVQAVSVSNDDVLDATWGATTNVADTLIATGDLHVSPLSADVVIAGTPVAGDLTFFRVSRQVADANDTLGSDARLIGIALFVTTNAQDDT